MDKYQLNKNKEIIEILSKKSWDSKIQIRNLTTDETFAIDSISSSTDDHGVPQITINFIEE